jgi:hypothetical protein
MVEIQEKNEKQTANTAADNTRSALAEEAMSSMKSTGSTIAKAAENTNKMNDDKQPAGGTLEIVPLAKDSANKANVGEAVKNGVIEAAKNGINEAVKQGAENAAKTGATQVGKNSIESSIKDGATEIAKHGAENMDKESAGSAIKHGAEEIGKKIGEAASQLHKSNDAEGSKGSCENSNISDAVKAAGSRAAAGAGKEIMDSKDEHKHTSDSTDHEGLKPQGGGGKHSLDKEILKDKQGMPNSIEHELKESKSFDKNTNESKQVGKAMNSLPNLVIEK